jgi:hypothetical protein
VLSLIELLTTTVHHLGVGECPRLQWFSHQLCTAEASAITVRPRRTASTAFLPDPRDTRRSAVTASVAVDIGLVESMDCCPSGFQF